MNTTGGSKGKSTGDDLPLQFTERLSYCINQYNDNLQNSEVENELRDMRSRIARIWINADTSRLEELYNNIPGKAQNLLLTSDFHEAGLSMKDENHSSKLCQKIRNEYHEPAAIRYLIALTIYKPAEELTEEVFKILIPTWFMSDFASYLLRPKKFFARKGEVDLYLGYMIRAVSFFHDLVYKSNTSEMPAVGSSGQNIASLFARHMYTIPLYFGHDDLKEIMLKRAQLVEAAQIEVDNRADYTFTRRIGSHNRIRLGILCAHYNPQTETFATLPVYEHLDRSRYEIILYGTELRGHPLEHYCQTRADKLVGLPKDKEEQLRLIRGDDLDILFIGSNITAVNSSVSQLATYRMAPVQVTSICSPVTTGMKNIDYYIAGDLTVSETRDKHHYTEQLATIAGSGLCFSFPGEDPTPSIKPERGQMGIPENTVLYISGANFFKIIPELREAWMRIIANVPDSLLLLYPFNPFWSRSYKAGMLLQQMQELLDSYNIDKERVVILKPFPTRSGIKAFLEICDVYLDAFPYGGATSIIDPLQTGLPPVVMEGDYLRFRQASAILGELQIPELIIGDEDSYIRLAVTLGRDRELRERLRREIAVKIQACPAFMDSKQYAVKIGNLLENLFVKSSDNHNTS